MKKYIPLLIAILVLAGAVWYTESAKQKTVPIASALYACDDGKTVDASYYAGTPVPVEPGEPPIPTGSVALQLSDGRSLTLPQTISASGIRYASGDESFIFWSKGDTAFITENSTTTFSNCVINAQY